MPTIKKLDQAELQIRAWADNNIFARGQEYGARGRVRDLAVSSEGELVAWVHGTGRYATGVTLAEEGPRSRCTCPYGATCKHAVAVALVYVHRSDNDPPLPTLSPNDPRLILLDRLASPSTTLTSVVSSANNAGDSALRSFLAGLAQPDLVELLLGLSQRFPEVLDALNVRQMLATDDADKLEREMLSRIVVATQETGWGEDWDDQDTQADYEAVLDGLQLLLDQDHADAVVRLGETLLERGINQVEHSHDEGEIGTEVGACLELVFQALPRSSLAPHEQLLWAIDAILRDPYDLCYGARAVLEKPYEPESWSQVADTLLRRLDGYAGSATGEARSDYERGHLADFAIKALSEAGRDDEILPVREREAEQNNSYLPLVEHLIGIGHRADAERWARAGIVATEYQYPGISSRLRKIIVTLWGEAGNWPQVAALRADEFFDRPTFDGFQKLQAAAEQAQVWPTVRTAVLHYLETGVRPQQAGRKPSQVDAPAWPLPDISMPHAEQRYPLQYPQIGLLIQVAAAEKQPDEVLRWYNQRDASTRYNINHDMVAEAIVDAYPERAATIWQKLAEAHIAQTSPAAYQEAAIFLRKQRRVWMREGKEAAWNEYVAALRTTNKRKRRLIETLDALVREKR